MRRTSTASLFGARPRTSVPSFWPDALQTLLLHAVLDQPGQAEAAAGRWLDGVDFDRIDAGSFRLLPLLYARLRASNIAHPLTARIKGVFRRNWYVEQRIRRQLRIVRTLFRDGGVDCILLKGTALGFDAYGHGAYRPGDDIDLLLRREDVERAVDLLVRAGWSVGLIAGMAGRHARIMHSDLCALDLHISPFHERLGEAATRPLWADRRRVDFDGAPADLLSTHDQLLHTLVHGMRTNPMPPIRWVADAVLMIRRFGGELDWDRFASRTEALAYTLVTSRGLAYLAAEYEVPVPQQVLARLSRRRKGMMMERIEFRCEREGHSRSIIANWLLRRRDARQAGIDQPQTRPRQQHRHE